jgi:acetylornithine deacetylase
MRNLFALTRALVDIESVSNNEMQVAAFLYGELAELAAQHGGRVERMPVEGERCNVFAAWGEPIVTLSTHMDTVPPFFPSSEDGEFIGGRGSCDAKGIIAAMVAAAETLSSEGTRNFGLLFLVGEERNSAGAKAAVREPRGSRYLINGEPTGNKLALASKGALRLEISAAGRMAHSGYPELGESAIEKLLDTLEAVRRIPLPADPLLGQSTINIGTLTGGRAPNVIADAAKAEVFVRLVGEPGPIREAVQAAAANRAEVKEIGHIPTMRFEEFDGLPTTIVSYTSDAPILSGAWGKALLIGPGSIHVAHTEEERVAKQELMEAVGIYAGMTRKLLARG